MEHSLGKKINFLSLIKYTFPTVIMMVFFSLYSIIDGMFVSRYVGSNALSAVNIVYPIISLLIGVSVMLATGGNAIVSKLIGENKNQEARESFTLIVAAALISGVAIAIVCSIFIKSTIYALGATDLIYDYCKDYLQIMLVFTPVIILKLIFDYFFVTAGRPGLGLACSLIGGITNIILDYIFIAVWNMGISGAAIATCIGYALPSIIGIFYFLNKKNTLHFVKVKGDLKIITEACVNGSSEMVTQLATAVTTFLYNVAMMKYLGEDGVAAITIILYVQFLLSAAYIGFTSGVAPRIGYNYGAENKDEIKKIIKYSLIFITGFSIITFGISKVMAEPLIALFAGRGTEVYHITLNGFNLFGLAFLLCGINIFASGMFTAFSNGKVSALLSVCRTFIFFIIGLMILAPILDLNGVWLVAPFAELLSLILSSFYIYKYRKTYGYGRVNLET